MESRNCSLPAPGFYSKVMHYSHIISFPLYLVTLIILFREKSKVFQTYKYFIIAHVFINIATESFVSFFMLPTTYLPHPLFRTTGWMSEWGFSGLVQFYIMAELSGTTVISILEMFYYRLKVTIVHQRVSNFIKFAKFQLKIFRGCLCVIPIISTITFSPSVKIQQEVAMKTWLQNTTFPPEITCYSVIIAVLDNTVFHITIGTYVVQILISVTGSVGPLIYIVRFMRRNFRLSAETKKLQRILIVSLFIQGAIHGTLIIIPTIFQIYALFFELSSDNFAHVLLVAFAYHGFISTCAMMIFTKPLRDKLIGWLQWTNRTVQQIQPQSDMISSQAPI